MNRAVAALEMPDVVPGYVETPLPAFRWVDPRDLLVAEDYQRNLTEKSLKLIKRIVKNWDWRRFKPPIVVETADGLEIVDGQHTSISAASHPQVDLIPVVVVSAPEMADRAKAFLGHNRDRLAVTSTQMHHAAVAANDDDAVTIEQVCERAGVTVLRTPPGQGAYKPGETLAVGQIGAIIAKYTPLRARQMLQVLVAARLAPIGVNEIRAIAHLMSEAEYKDHFKPEDMATAIQGLGEQAFAEAKVFAHAHRVPAWKGLAVTWFRGVKKVRANAKP